MTERLAILILTFLVALLVALAPARGVATAPAGTSDRQILVMVRHPADHYRPGGSYGEYGDVTLAKSERERLAREIAARHGLKLVDNWPMPMIGMDCFVMAVPDGRTTAAAADEVSRDRAVAWVEPVELFEARSANPDDNDPLYPAQPAAIQWKLADLHRMATGRGVRIAVVDSGIDASHPDLAGQILVNRNFVFGQSEAAEQHGTGVAGVIAAKANNEIGIAGVAPDSRLLGLRACWQESSPSGKTVCDSFSLAKAMYFAIEQKSDVINLSLSGSSDRLLRTLIDTAIARGSTVVCAVDPNKSDGGFPASVPGVIAVADRLAPGARNVYTAPGRDVPTTEPGGRWFLVNGSSFSAAHVSGLVALMRQVQSSPRVTLVSERSGGGAINACATLLKVARTCDCACDSPMGSSRH